MEHAYKQFVQIRAALSPSRVRAVRYEDLTRNPEIETRDLLTWAGVRWTENTEKYVRTHTTR